MNWYEQKIKELQELQKLASEKADQKEFDRLEKEISNYRELLK